MKKVYIVEAKRSAIGRFGGALKDLPVTDIAADVARAAMLSAGVSPDSVDETILGHVLSAGTGMGPGRQVSIKAGIPEDKPGYTLNILCCSGMKSVMTARTRILAGESELIIAGGMENMSSAPFLLPAAARWGQKLGPLETSDHMVSDGLTDVFNDCHMGVTAENIADKHLISREAQDSFAMESQKRAVAAVTSGRFTDEIVPIELNLHRNTTVFREDEYPRSDASLKDLSELRPAFSKDGTVTAGNSSGINDGAAILIVASENAVSEYGLKPLAEIVAVSQAGIAPDVMGLGPVPAIAGLLDKSGFALRDIDLIELNEAFAAQALGVMKELSSAHGVTEEWILERCNVNGGAIALGHPIGASGARILVTLLHEMIKQGAETGLASLCAGGGMGTAVLIKKV